MAKRIGVSIDSLGSGGSLAVKVTAKGPQIYPVKRSDSVLTLATGMAIGGVLGIMLSKLR